MAPVRSSTASARYIQGTRVSTSCDTLRPEALRPRSRRLIITAQQNTTATLAMWMDCEVGTTHVAFCNQLLKLVFASQFAQPCVTCNIAGSYRRRICASRQSPLGRNIYLPLHSYRCMSALSNRN